MSFQNTSSFLPPLCTAAAFAKDEVREVLPVCRVYIKLCVKNA